MHLHPILRFFVRFLVRSVLVLLFIGLPAVLLYLREVGLGFGIKEQVEAALSGSEFQTSIGKLTLDPFTGLVANRVEIHSRKPPERHLARIERLVVSANLSDLTGGKITIDHIVLNDTNVSVPLSSDPNGQPITLNGVSAQCVFMPNQMRISYFEGTVQGIRVILSGLLHNPQGFQVGTREDSSTQNTPKPDGTLLPRSLPLEQWLDRFAELKFTTPPELRAEIHGDLADRSTLEVRPLTLRSGAISGPNWRIEGLDLEAEYRDGGLTVGKLVVRDRHGSLTATADWREQRLTFDLMSSLNPGTFAGLLPEKSPLRGLKMPEAPLVNASGSVFLGSSPAQYNVLGSVTLGKFTYQGVAFDHFSTSVAARDGEYYLRDIRVEAGGGALDADALIRKDDFRVRFENTIKPTHIVRLLGEKEREFVGQMEFRDPPYVRFELRGPKPDFASIRGEGILHLGRTAVRKAWMDQIDSKFEIADSAFIYRDFTITRGKGRGTGTFIYDIGRREVRLENIKATLPPVDVLMWIDPTIADALRPYRFREPPKALVAGMVHLKDPDKNNLSVKVESEEGLDYDLLNRTLKFGKTSADVAVKGRRVLANIKKARLMGGDAQIRANVSIDSKDPVFSANVDLHRVDFAKLTKLYFDYDDSLGVMSAHYNFSADLRAVEKMTGKGSIRVEDGHVFAIPILGPLSDIINKIIPKAGYQTARLATADFTIANEKIHTPNLVIEGSGFSLFGVGNIFFMKDRLDMSVRINARGIPGIVLFPVSKLFEYVSTGSVANPEWKPKIIPRFGSGEQKATP